MVKKYTGLLIFTIILACYGVISVFIKNNIMLGIMFWAIFIFLLFVLNKKSILQTTTISDMGIKGRITTIIFAVLLILLCTLPMGLAPFWNGKIPMHRNQYELMADSIMHGHLYFEYDDIDSKLLEMENPYDYEERIRQGVVVHYDHAFYNGHYYMYFGVVPVFLLFIPFKLIFGKTLVTFHATQFFMAMGIIAFFLLFYFIAKKYFPKLPLGTYLISTAAIAIATIGYFVQAPALYCTAISSGVCLMLWSILFYFYAVYFAKKEWEQVLFAVLGALAGALAFGCRPPAALANIIAIPMAIAYAKNYKGKHLIRNFIFVMLPYIIIALLLMWYNYARFEDPFEFGQAYQLTTYDQTSFSDFFARMNIWSVISGLFYNFFYTMPLDAEFPHFSEHGGFLITYPIMWLVVGYLAQNSLRKELKKDKMSLFAWALLLVPVIVTIADVQWAPGLCERYRLDAYFVLGILAYLLIGFRMKTTEKQQKVVSTANILSVITLYVAFLLFMNPLDANFAMAFPEKAEAIKNIILFR